MNRINLNLDKQQYISSDKITGSVVLSLREPLKAKKLSVNLIVTKKIKRMSIPSVSQGSVGVSGSSSKSRLYSFELILDTEKEYADGEEYPFEISIPSEAVQKSAGGQNSVGGILGGALSILSQISPIGQSVYLYKIEARLDIPWKIDLTSDVDITIE